MPKNKIAPLAFLLGMFFSTTRVEAQLVTNKAVLQKASQEMARIETETYQKLVTLSKEKGWPMVLTGKKGSKALLVGIDAQGYPQYVTTYKNIISAAAIKTNLLWPGGSKGLN